MSSLPWTSHSSQAHPTTIMSSSASISALFALSTTLLLCLAVVPNAAERRYRFCSRHCPPNAHCRTLQDRVKNNVCRVGHDIPGLKVSALRVLNYLGHNNFIKYVQGTQKCSGNNLPGSWMHKCCCHLCSISEIRLHFCNMRSNQ